MHVTVFTEYRFHRHPSGEVYAHTGNRAYDFWNNYLACFDSVTVVGRVSEIPDVGGLPVQGPSVEVQAVPHFVGPQQYFLRRKTVARVVQDSCNHEGAFILRVPGTLGSLAYRCLHRQGKPYAAEIVGDPAGVFSSGSVKHPLRPLIRPTLVRTLKRIACNACGSAYVTRRALQKLYPCTAGEFAVPDIHLPEEAFATSPKEPWDGSRPPVLVLVGSLEQLYKGPDILLDAVADCRRQHFPMRVIIVGDGRHRSELEQKAAVLGLSESVEFRGAVPSGAAVRAVLDEADLFVMPSRTEGMPRALLEAMARGLPCVASAVGGIPELLSPDEMVKPGDSHGLSLKLREVLGDAARLRRMAVVNLELAKDFRVETLAALRMQFYRHVHECTQAGSLAVHSR